MGGPPYLISRSETDEGPSEDKIFAGTGKRIVDLNSKEALI